MQYNKHNTHISFIFVKMEWMCRLTLENKRCRTLRLKWKSFAIEPRTIDKTFATKYTHWNFSICFKVFAYNETIFTGTQYANTISAAAWSKLARRADEWYNAPSGKTTVHIFYRYGSWCTVTKIPLNKAILVYLIQIRFYVWS